MEIIRIAQSASEASAWRHAAVVVDVLRCSSTLCALLSGGCPEVTVYADMRLAAAACRRRPEADLFSELDFRPPLPKYDNSPYLALTRRRRRAPAIMVTSAGTRALLSLRRARRVLVGCFANLPALAGCIRQEAGPWLIVPACLYFDPRHMEDVYCARAIRDACAARETAGAWVADLRAGSRPAEFLAGRPDTGRADLRLALSVGKFRVVPRARIRGNLARVA